MKKRKPKTKQLKKLTDDKVNKIQLRYLKKFLKEKSLPQQVGQPEGFNQEGYHKIYLKHLGFKGIDVSGGFFTFLQMPKGWKKVITKHSNQWCYLIDDQRRDRGAIFYKVVAVSNTGGIKVLTFINWMQRLIVRTSTFKGKISSTVFDSANVIYKSQEYDEPKERKEKSEIEIKCFTECELWLNDNYPEWKNVSAYWDVELTKHKENT